MTSPECMIFAPEDGIGAEILEAAFGTPTKTRGRTGRCGGTITAGLAGVTLAHTGEHGTASSHHCLGAAGSRRNAGRPQPEALPDCPRRRPVTR